MQNSSKSRLGGDWRATLERRRQRGLQTAKNSHDVAKLAKQSGGGRGASRVRAGRAAGRRRR
eukprot:2896308-Alexandrium_andersonii.AAC.1